MPLISKTVRDRVISRKYWILWVLRTIPPRPLIILLSKTYSNFGCHFEFGGNGKGLKDTLSIEDEKLFKACKSVCSSV